MRILILISVVLLCGCAKTTWLPSGSMGNLHAWYTSLNLSVKCNYCGGYSTLYKRSTSGKVMCETCFNKKVKHH